MVYKTLTTPLYFNNWKLRVKLYGATGLVAAAACTCTHVGHTWWL